MSAVPSIDWKMCKERYASVCTAARSIVYSTEVFAIRLCPHSGKRFVPIRSHDHREELGYSARTMNTGEKE
jgi:hypothetical protein